MTDSSPFSQWSMKAISMIGRGWLAILLLLNTAMVDAQETDKKPRPKVAVMVFEGVELLDFAGPAELLGTCTDEHGDDLLEVFTVGVSKKAIESIGLLSINPKYDPTDAPVPNIVVIPGGNVMSLMEDDNTVKWIHQQYKNGCTILSVCNGASVLAKMGLLEGLQVATHHSNREILELLEPKAHCVTDRRFIDHGRIITTAGVSAGIDGALYLIAKLFGSDTAKRSATGAEFDYWIGFKDIQLAIPSPDSKGLISQAGRVHEREIDWTVFKLLKIITKQGVEAACHEYPSMFQKSSGHDREMIEEEGLTETAQWLLDHGRDPNVGLSILQFIALAHPNSSNARRIVGEALVNHKKIEDAKRFLQKAIDLDADDSKAKSLLEEITR